MSTDKSKVELSTAWLDDEDDIIEEEETVFGGGSESPFIQGYGAYGVKITMAKVINFPSSKVEFIEIDFVNQADKTHREKFMVRGKDGKTFFTKNGKKTQHFGINKIKSLLKVAKLYPDVEAKSLMAALYGNTETADVTWEEFGTEKTEEFTIFPDLIGAKVKICITSKKENSQKNTDQDDSSEQAYVQACMKLTKAYIKANPKRKSLAKFDIKEGYVNVARWFVVSSVSHFCSTAGLFASELDSGEGALLDSFLERNEDGEIFDGRTIIPEDMTEATRNKLGINEYGKQVEADDGDYDEPVEEEVSDETEDDEW